MKQEVHWLVGKLITLSRFISQSIDRCLPFFATLHSNFEWSSDSAVVIDQLKAYLRNAPLLSRPTLGDTLYLYPAVNARAVSTDLICEEDDIQRPVHYLSRALCEAEERYSPIEPVAFALLTTAFKLRSYFQAHTVAVLTNLPLKKTLQNVEASGRLLQWVVKLSEFDILHQPRHKIEGQAIVDFLVKIDEPDHGKDYFLEEPTSRAECT